MIRFQNLRFPISMLNQSVSIFIIPQIIIVITFRDNIDDGADDDAFDDAFDDGNNGGDGINAETVDIVAMIMVIIADSSSITVRFSLLPLSLLSLLEKVCAVA